MRIVSLIPSATEIVCALGFEKNLMGRSHECDFPESVKGLPICTEPSFNPVGTSREIDERVKDRLRKALSIYKVLDELKNLAPDFIVTQTQCEVCAVSLKEVENSLQSWIGNKPQVVPLSPNSLADIWLDMGRVANAFGATDRGEKLIAGLKTRMEKIASIGGKIAKRPRVLCVEWIDPLMAAGNWIPELVTMVGGVCLFGKAGEHSPWIKTEEFWTVDPDVILIMPCGFDMARTEQELFLLTSQPRWKSLTAVKNNQVYLVDGNQYFNRPGPRVVESLEIMAEILHPSEFSFGHTGRGWKRI